MRTIAILFSALILSCATTPPKPETVDKEIVLACSLDEPGLPL